jgi:hypothetical protein
MGRKKHWLAGTGQGVMQERTSIQELRRSRGYTKISRTTSSRRGTISPLNSDRTLLAGEDHELILAMAGHQERLRGRVLELCHLACVQQTVEFFFGEVGAFAGHLADSLACFVGFFGDLCRFVVSDLGG